MLYFNYCLHDAGAVLAAGYPLMPHAANIVVNDLTQEDAAG
jgi:hypothetical protein